MALTVATLIVDTRTAVGEMETGLIVQDFDCLQAIGEEVLNLENWLTLQAPEWLSYDTTENISVTSGTWSYTLSTNKIFHRARAIYSGSNNEEDLNIGGPGASRYWLDRVGEKIYLHPIPYEAFTLTLYERSGFSGALPTLYADDLVNATTPKGFPFWAESYMRAAVISNIALRFISRHPKFKALYEGYFMKATQEKASLVGHAASQRPLQTTIDDADDGLRNLSWLRF